MNQLFQIKNFRGDFHDFKKMIILAVKNSLSGFAIVEKTLWQGIEALNATLSLSALYVLNCSMEFFGRVS